MNYLAHTWLAGEDTGLLIGGIAGDFVKGRLRLEDETPIQRGVRLHRSIDRFTDAHAICARSRGRFTGPHRRVAGIITDMAYDHFLAANWDLINPHEPLTTFTARVYALLGANQSELPAGLRRILPRMHACDWLGSYRELDALSWALRGIGTRMRRGGGALDDAIDGVIASYTELRGDFFEFLPELREFATIERTRLVGASPREPQL
jgi:acyl carrier protein phosphodiesterase